MGERLEFQAALQELRKLPPLPPLVDGRDRSDADRAGREAMPSERGTGDRGGGGRARPPERNQPGTMTPEFGGAGGAWVVVRPPPADGEVGQDDVDAGGQEQNAFLMSVAFDCSVRVLYLPRRVA